MASPLSLLACLVPLVALMLIGCADAAEVVARINFGPAVHGYDAYDQKAASGNVKIFTAGRDMGIDRTEHDLLYSSHAYSDATFSYTIPVEGNAKYDVRLGFAEVYFCNQAGQRSFSASVGDRTIADIDVFQKIGCKAAHNVVVKAVSPSDGAIKVTLRKGSQSMPMISNIEVLTAESRSETLNVSEKMVASDGIPMINSEWQTIAAYPGISVGEAMGAVIGNELVVAGGFLQGTDYDATAAAYAYSFGSNSWRQLANMPIAYTHGAQVVVGGIFYICGGYNGKHPGPPMTDCISYSLKFGTWSILPELPAPRAGGGMVYIASANSLVFAGGATRPGDEASTIDHDDTWALNLGDLSAGWQTRAAMPNPRNHLSAVEVQGRYFWIGGQDGGDEKDGNQDSNNEYNYDTDTWFTKTSMPFGRSHHSASSPSYGGGFLVTAGSINGNEKTGSVLFYDVNSDTWHDLGVYPRAIPTPVCGVIDNKLICSTGYSTRSFYTNIGYSSADVGVPVTNVEVSSPVGPNASIQIPGIEIPDTNIGVTAPTVDDPVANIEISSSEGEVPQPTAGFDL